jgi:AAA domain/RepB DNA-primase from phage plasmid/Primase C terminal 1 (PriCT-1)
MHGEPTSIENGGDAVHSAKVLWQHIFSDERGLLAICRTDGSKFSTQYFNYPQAANSAAEWALEKSQAGDDVYFCAHLLTEARRIKENATAVHALWGDLDGVEVPKNDLAPTAVVQSSPGKYHCYWRLADPVPPETAESLNERLAKQIGADTSGFDLTQLLRVPGTANHKYDAKPVVKTTSYAPNYKHYYTAGDLDRILPQPQTPDFAAAAPVGAEILDGSRNKTLTSIAGSLRRRGLDAETIFAALVSVNETKCRPPLRKVEVEQIAHSVARYEPANGRNSHSHSRIGNVNVNEEENPTNNHPKKHLRAISFAGREKPPPQKFVVEKVVPRTLATSFYGGGGLAKSVNVLHLGLSVAFVGVAKWHGLEVTTSPVIYLDFEMSEIVQLRRAKEIAEGAGWPDVPKNFHYVEAAGHPTTDVFGFAQELVEQHGPSFIIVDSFGFSMQGESERSADVLSYVRNYIQPLQEGGSTPLVVDHISKAIKGERAADKEAFGSVYKTNAMRSTVNLTGHADEDAGTVYATFTHRKNNVGPRLKPFTVITRFSAEDITFERSDTVIHPPTEDTIEQLIVVAVREVGPMTNKQIAAEIDRDLRSVQNSTSRLKNAGVLVETGEKVDREAVLELAAQ